MARGPSMKVQIAAMRAEGNFFRRDVTRTIAANTKDAVEWVTEKGPPMVRNELSDLKQPTGFTARSIEDVMLPDRLTRGDRLSVRGQVRMKPGLSRGGSANWPASRVPYVINAVLETGKWGGRTTSRVAHKQFKRTASRLRAYTRAIRTDFAKGLE